MVATRIKLVRAANNALLRAKLEVQRSVPQVLIKDIKDSILRGNSPVKGQRRYERYSPSYSKQIRFGKSFKREFPDKRLRPVNLKLTGKMLRSLRARITRDGFTIFFTSPLADIHNRQGAGKSKAIRRLLPTKRGEEFKRAIFRRSKDIIQRIYKKAFGGI